MAIEIKSRNVVPDKEGNLHRGKHASLAMDDAGFRAWGFGDTKTQADRNAFDRLCSLREKLCQVQ